MKDVSFHLKNQDVKDSLTNVLIMAEEMLTKIVNESPECFMCLSLCSVDDRFFIFGKVATILQK